MRFQCQTHGELDTILVNGYSIAHEPQVNLHEKDLEGITFVINSPKGEALTADHISTEQSTAIDYLEKFTNWRNQIKSAIESFYDTGRSVEELSCPHNHSGLSQTHIVDNVFIPETTYSNIQYTLIGIFDDIAKIEYPQVSLDTKEEREDLVSQWVSEAKEREANKLLIKIRSNIISTDILESVGFDTTVETVQGLQEEYQEITAMKDL